MRAFLNDFGVESILVGIVSLILLIVLIVCFFPYQVEAEVTSRIWISDVAVERWQENTHEDWDVPQGGVIVKSEQRIRTDLLDNSNNFKNDTWYTYTIWEWTTVRHIVATGADSPHWGNMTDIHDQDKVNPERFGAKSATFKTEFKGSDGKEYNWTGLQLMWEQLEVGTKVRLTVNSIGSLYAVERIH